VRGETNSRVANVFVGGQLPNLLPPNDFDEPLPESELARWEDPEL
jgi:hypothetical protein